MYSHGQKSCQTYLKFRFEHPLRITLFVQGEADSVYFTFVFSFFFYRVLDYKLYRRGCSDKQGETGRRRVKKERESEGEEDRIKGKARDS